MENTKPIPREILDHVVHPENDKLRIFVTDGPGSGGAHHRYEIFNFDASSNPSHGGEKDEGTHHKVILFQNGPIGEAGVNGITQEALLAICIDRLRCFQAGPFACEANAIALTHLETALMWLQKRTRDRMARGVEGTHAQ